MKTMIPIYVEQEIAKATSSAGKSYCFDESHNQNRPVGFWFQDTCEGETLFIVFYSQACRWSRCLGCNLPSVASKHHIDFRKLMAQIDFLFCRPEICSKRLSIRKVIVSNNGSMLDQVTFSTTALMYLVAELNMNFPNLSVLSLETRVEYVDIAELEILARAIQEGETPTNLELAIGFECFDPRLRNGVFKKGLELDRFEDFCKIIASHQFQLKCYFMQKPVVEMSDEEAIEDIKKAIDYLSEMSSRLRLNINMHLNPTYAAKGTALGKMFIEGKYSPPRLADVAKAALHAEGKKLSIFIGLSDEGLAVSGGSFLREGEESIVSLLKSFNKSQDYSFLRQAIAPAG